MDDVDCTAFLQWALPRIGLRWRGFRKVRRRVCRRILRRVRELGLGGFDDYRARLEEDPGERRRLDALCLVTISRFHRDRAVFEGLAGSVLPALLEAFRDPVLRCWCAGCASGEEAYTLRILWDLVVGPRHPARDMSIVATDADERVIARARRGTFPVSSLKELPPAWREAAFVHEDGTYRLRDRHRRGIELRVEDMRTSLPAGPLHLVLCRNAAFTYFAEPAQRDFLERLTTRLAPGAALVLGAHESLPEGSACFSPWEGVRCVHRFTGGELRRESRGS